MGSIAIRDGKTECWGILRHGLRKTGGQGPLLTSNAFLHLPLIIIGIIPTQRGFHFGLVSQFPFLPALKRDRCAGFGVGARKCPYINSVVTRDKAVIQSENDVRKFVTEPFYHVADVFVADHRIAPVDAENGVIGI